jgi:hypothetical protein
MGGTRRSRVEPTDEWEQLRLLGRWPEQLAYEEIPPTVLFGSTENFSVSARPGCSHALRYCWPSLNPETSVRGEAEGEHTGEAGERWFRTG